MSVRNFTAMPSFLAICCFTTLFITQPLAAGEIAIADAGAGTDFRGAVFMVDQSSGFRTLVSDFGNADQGPLCQNSRGAAFEPAGTLLVIDPFVGTSNLGALFRVDLSTGLRTILSDFGDPGQGPTGGFPIGVTLEPAGTIIATDVQANVLFRIDPATGSRTIASDFSDPLQGPSGISLIQADTGSGGELWVTDSDAGTGFFGALFRIDPTTGARVLISDFGDVSQGPTNPEISGLAIEANGQVLVAANSGTISGQILRIDPGTGNRSTVHDFDVDGGPSCGVQGVTAPNEIAVQDDGDILVLTTDTLIGVPGEVHRIDPASGSRSLVSCFGDPMQGALGVSPTGIDVRKIGQIFADGFESGSTSAWR